VGGAVTDRMAFHDADAELNPLPPDVACEDAATAEG
jgi:hypothetical protein